MAQSVTGSFTATGQSAALLVKGIDDRREIPVNMSLRGTFVGSVAVERKFDGDANWYPLTALGSTIAFTGPCSEIFYEAEAGMTYRLNCTAFTSGTINYRLSQ